MDTALFVSQSDLIYHGMICSGESGMPVAGGRFGGPVWQEDDCTLIMQLNHTDTFMYNDASANSLPESGALGFLRIHFGAPCFHKELFQHLHLYEGVLELRAQNLNIRVTADFSGDVICMQIQDSREQPQPIKVSLHMCREPEVCRGTFRAISAFDTQSLSNHTLLLHQIFSETCDTGISANDHYCSTAAAVEVRGRTIEKSESDRQSAVFTLSPDSNTFDVIISGISAMDSAVDVIAEAKSQLHSNPGYDETSILTKKFLAAFYDKSYIDLPNNRDYQQRWTYFLYLSLISNRGMFPSKYNGGNWIGLGDRRDWGCWYWNWNQDSVYQPLNSANHMELMDPLFSMRERSFENYKAAARQCFGIQNTDAVFIGETIGILGAEILPDEIAAALTEYLTGDEDAAEQLKAFGERRNSFLTPFNWKLSPFGCVSYVTHTLVATQETAEYYWQRYCYTKDLNFLKNRAYPFIKGAAELYRNYPGFIKKADGLYHFHRTNLHEHIWGGDDVADDLMLARGIFPVAIYVSKLLDIDHELAEKWAECLKHLAPYPRYGEEDSLGYTFKDLEGKTIFAQGRTPATKIGGLDCTESPKLKMLEKFDILNMESRDQGTDQGDFQLALDTYLVSPGYENQYLDTKEDLNGSSRFPETAAKLGRADELYKILATQYQMFQNTPNLIHDQGDFYSIEGYGTFAMALQQALMQSLAPSPAGDHVIRIFPAWPKDQDCSFKLLAKGGFVVESSLKDGSVEFVKIESQLGEVLRLRSPFASQVKISSSTGESKVCSFFENELIVLETVKHECITLEPVLD